MYRSGFVRLTQEVAGEEPGSRIKVLWIDDRPELIFADHPDLFAGVNDYFDIYTAATPEDVADGFRKSREAVSRGFGGALYDLPQVPFDVYIGDWNLSAAALGQRTQPSVAKDAEAAGLAASVLAAAHYPFHPAVVLPYSAYWEQLQAYGELYRCLAPRTLLVAWEAGAQLKHNQAFTFLPSISSLYRRALVRGFKSGRVALTLPSARAAERATATADACEHWLRSDASLDLMTAWGSRLLQVKALWLDVLGDLDTELPPRDYLLSLARRELCPPTPEDELEVLPEQELRRLLLLRWLRSIPMLREECQNAENLAWEYLRHSCSAESRGRYALREEAERVVASGAALSADSPLRRLLPTHEGPLAEQDLKGLRHEQSARPPHLIKAGGTTEDDRCKRLSVLMLLLLEAKFRAFGRQVAELKHGNKALWQMAMKLERDALGDQLYESFKEGVELKRSFYSVLAPGDALRLLDPFPGKISFKLEISKGTTVGAALNRLDPPLFLAEMMAARKAPALLDPRKCPDWRAFSKQFEEEKRKPKDKRTHPTDFLLPGLSFNVKASTPESIAPVAEETSLVREIFDRFLTELTFRGVAQALRNGPGNSGLEHALGRGLTLDAAMVRKVLTSSLYVGLLEVGDDHYRGDHEPILELPLFHEVQQRIGYPMPEEVRLLRAKALALRLPPESWPWWINTPEIGD